MPTFRHKFRLFIAMVAALAMVLTGISGLSTDAPSAAASDYDAVTLGADGGIFIECIGRGSRVPGPTGDRCTSPWDLATGKIGRGSRDDAPTSECPTRSCDGEGDGQDAGSASCYYQGCGDNCIGRGSADGCDDQCIGRGSADGCDDGVYMRSDE